jgi:hypothetical protein
VFAMPSHNMQIRLKMTFKRTGNDRLIGCIKNQTSTGTTIKRLKCGPEMKSKPKKCALSDEKSVVVTGCESQSKKVTVKTVIIELTK